MRHLGSMHDGGGLGLEPSRARAAEIWRRAADLGNPGAMTNLAFLYFTGAGVPLDQQAAARRRRSSSRARGKEARQVRYYKMAAVKGDAAVPAGVERPPGAAHAFPPPGAE